MLHVASQEQVKSKEFAVLVSLVYSLLPKDLFSEHLSTMSVL